MECTSGAGGTANHPVMVRPVHEHGTTVRCSCCGGRTEAPMVRDYRTHQWRRSMSLRQSVACGWRCGEQEGERKREGERERGGGGRKGLGHGARRQGSRACQSHRGYCQHRELNAAWNLWCATAADYGMQPRPQYLQHQSHGTAR